MWLAFYLTVHTSLPLALGALTEMGWSISVDGHLIAVVHMALRPGVETSG